jgi:hypothetical protein
MVCDRLVLKLEIINNLHVQLRMMIWTVVSETIVDESCPDVLTLSNDRVLHDGVL